jgi:LDH2 family malate/lactate/ureidoglycolate dehydrogenase
MIGFSFTIGGITHMTAWGGAQGILGNNPFSIALPAGEERPVVLDMACSTAARGKILVAAKDHAPTRITGRPARMAKRPRILLRL